MTKAERLRDRADEIETEAAQLRWTNPGTARHLDHIARELRTIANGLPPERGQQ